MSDSEEDSLPPQEQGATLQALIAERDAIAALRPFNIRAYDGIQRKITDSFNRNWKSPTAGYSQRSRKRQRIFTDAAKLQAMGADVLVVVALNTKRPCLNIMATPRMQQLTEQREFAALLGNVFPASTLKVAGYVDDAGKQTEKTIDLTFANAKFAVIPASSSVSSSSAIVQPPPIPASYEDALNSMVAETRRKRKLAE